MTAGCFVAWPVATDATDRVRDIVQESLAGADGRGVGALLAEVGAQTASVFLRRSDSDAPHLTWYVEHDGREAWRDPAAAIREGSPLFPRLDDALDGSATVIADDAAGVAEFVHAALPDRPTAYADQTDALPVVCSANDPDGGRPDVVPLVLRVRSGLGSLLARSLTWLVARTPTWLDAKFEAASLDVMEAEGMYTETLLLARDPDGYRVWWYMESGGMERVKDAYYESASRVARASEHVLGWVLERPERALAHPVEASDFELLAHAVAADR